MRAGPSNAVMQDRLKASQGNAPQPVRANPAPWAAQNRSVRFEPVSRGALFQDGAAVEDVVQGQNGSRYLGDCWLLSALAAIANTQPKVLEDAITDHGDGTYTVRLHKQDTRGLMSSEDDRVEGTLPRTADGQDAYAQRSDPTEKRVGIIEKTFASWKGGYGTLDGGIPSDALTALTGQSSETVFMKGADSGELSSSMQEAASAQRPMVAASRADLSLKKGGKEVELTPAFRDHLNEVWVPFAQDVIDSFLKWSYVVISYEEMQDDNRRSSLLAKRRRTNEAQTTVKGRGSRAARAAAAAAESAPPPVMIPLVPILGSYEVAFAMGGRCGYQREYMVYSHAPGQGTREDELEIFLRSEK